MAGEIVGAGGAEPILIPCDLEHPNACDKIDAALAAAGVEVEFVVNNAEFGLFGCAIELDRAEQLGAIAVNILAMTNLSLSFSDSLIRHRGGILNLGWRDIMPLRPMSYRSEALHQELSPWGVRVTALCPGSVLSEFQCRT